VTIVATPLTDGATRNRLNWTVIRTVVAVVVLVAVFAYAVPKLADYGSIWAVLTRLSWAQLSLLLAVTMVNVVSCWPPVVASLPGLTLGQAAVNTQTAAAIANTVPGGGVLAVGLTCMQFRSWGFSSGSIALSVLLTGIWNSLIKLALPVLAVALLALTGTGGGALLLPALAGLGVLALAMALFGLVMRSKEFARRIGGQLGVAASWLRRLVRKAPVIGWGDAAVGFRRQSNDLVGRRWLALTVTTTASHLSLYLVFLLTIRLVGITGAEVSWAETFGIFALGRLLSAAPITPGGVGILELTYIAGLVLAGGGEVRAQAVAAAVLFRVLTSAAQIPFGAVTYLIWQRRRSWRIASPSRTRPGWGRRPEPLPAGG
jgi:putative heme transporter